MSIMTWLDEFGKKTDLEKWIGLRKDNLEKHECFLDEHRDVQDYGENVFYINSITCQLCEDFYNDIDEIEECANCPLFKIGKCCSHEGSPYRIHFETGNPEPMIEALTEVVGELPQRKSGVNEYY